MRLRAPFAVLSSAAICASLMTVVAAPQATAATACDALTQDVVQVVKPTTNQSLLTRSPAEADTFTTTRGFTVDNGAVFAASPTMGTGLVAIHRMRNPNTGDLHTVKAGAVGTWIAKGYVNKGVRFYALSRAQSCAVPVYNYAKGTKNRQVVSTDARAQLQHDGWLAKGIAYYAASANPPPNPDDPDADGRFSIAVIPDTQIEVFYTDQRFPQRTQWLVDNRKNLDLRFVGHTGDVTNWGWLMPSQLTVADTAARVLDDAGMPYAWAIGNHDTRAVGHDGIPGSRGYGGSAYVNNPECVERLSVEECKSWLLVRDTQEFNAIFTAERFGSVAGSFEPGKVDNIYSTFEAGGRRWLMLTIELWPRPAAVAWARSVVEAHPGHNVLVQTHSYLTANGTIYQDNGGYGETSPQYLFDNLIKLYPNIKAVFSGHVGSGAQRMDTGVNGNKVMSYLGNFGSATTNPVRLVEFDVRGGSITTTVVAPFTDETVVPSKTDFGMSFVS